MRFNARELAQYIPCMVWSDNKLLIKCCWLYESCTFAERSFWIEGRAVFTIVKSINLIKPNRLTPISAHHFLFVFVDCMHSLGNLSLLMIHMAQKQCQAILQVFVELKVLTGDTERFEHLMHVSLR